MNTLEWLLRLKSDADEALKIAALGHDIGRALEERKIRREDYEKYDEFKQEHALNSAKILKKIMKDCHLGEDMINDIFILVARHEIGGNTRVNTLKNADAISFFHVNLPHFFLRHSIEETKKRCAWGYKKIPRNLQEIVLKFTYENKKLESFLGSLIANI